MKKYFDYLEQLRHSYLQQEFPELSYDHAQAVYILREWMRGHRKGGDGQC